MSIAARTALTQWAICVGAGRLLGDYLVNGRPVAAEERLQFQAECDALADKLRTTRNVLRDGYGNKQRIIDAYKSMKVPFLSSWEMTELDVVDGLAKGFYDSAETLAAARPWGVSAYEPWFLVMHGGAEGAAKAKPMLLATGSPWDRWLATGELDDATRAGLVTRFESASAPLVTAPVKTSEKLDRQIGAFLEGKLSREVLEKSFKQWFAYCYHHESPSNFGEKIPHIVAYAEMFERKSPTEALAFVKSCLAPFKKARVAARRIHVLDVEPIAEALAAIRGS